MAWSYIHRLSPALGLRSAPKIFNAVVDFLAWVLHCEGVSLLIHYLDNFLLFCPVLSMAAAIARSCVEPGFSHIGAPLAHHKTVGPSTVLTFPRIQINIELLQLSLLHEKVACLQELLQEWGKKKHCTKKELVSLFLRTLFSLLSRLRHPDHFARLNLEARANIAWWQSLLHYWNG